MLHDTHAHLDLLLQKLDLLEPLERQTFHPDYAYNYPQGILQKLLKRHAFIIQSTLSTDNFLLTHKLFSHNPKVKFLIGSHPQIIHETFETTAYLQSQKDLLLEYNFVQFNELDTLELVDQRGILGLGECGLDYHFVSDKEIVRKQWDLFESQINLACSLGLPLVIHTRDSFTDTLAILQKFPQIRGRYVFHCFSESIDELEQVLQFDGYIGIGGVVTFKNADQLREVVQVCPLDRLLVETDLPFLAPVPYRGKNCLPEYVDSTVLKLGQIKGLEHVAIWQQLERNAREFFGV